MSTTETSFDHPAQLDLDYSRRHSRLLLFFRGLLALPHAVALLVLYLASFVLTLVAAVSVLVTRHYPRSIFGFNVGVMRWGFRLTAYLDILTDRYPPFSLGAHDDYPVRFHVEYPGSVARWRVLFAWIVALPALIVTGLLSYVLLILTAIVWFVILVTGRYPRAIFNFNLYILRLTARTNAYTAFMVTRYPL